MSAVDELGTGIMLEQDPGSRIPEAALEAAWVSLATEVLGSCLGRIQDPGGCMGECGHLGTGIMPEQDPGGCMGECD